MTLPMTLPLYLYALYFPNIILNASFLSSLLYNISSTLFINRNTPLPLSPYLLTLNLLNALFLAL